MYNFRLVQSNYTLETSVRQGESDCGSCRILFSVNGRYRHESDNFICTIGRHEVVVRNCTGSQSPADSVMERLGNALFPVKLRVAPSGRILGVDNLKQIQENWNKESHEMMSGEYSVSTARYITLAKQNFAGEVEFIKSFERQLFIQLLFRNSGEDFFQITLHNLSYPGSSDIIQCQETDKDGNRRRFKCSGDRIFDSYLEYEFSELGDVLAVSGRVIKQNEDNEPLIKEIKVVADMSSREAKRTNKLLSLLID